MKTSYLESFIMHSVGCSGSGFPLGLKKGSNNQKGVHILRWAISFTIYQDILFYREKLCLIWVFPLSRCIRPWRFQDIPQSLRTGNGVPQQAERHGDGIMREIVVDKLTENIFAAQAVVLCNAYRLTEHFATSKRLFTNGSKRKYH